jgi:ribosomal protein S14
MTDEVCGWCKAGRVFHSEKGLCPRPQGGYFMTSFKVCRHPSYERMNVRDERCVVCGTKRPLTRDTKPAEEES